jgi:hypothetical protein
MQNLETIVATVEDGRSATVLFYQQQVVAIVPRSDVLDFNFDGKVSVGERFSNIVMAGRAGRTALANFFQKVAVSKEVVSRDAGIGTLANNNWRAAGFDLWIWGVRTVNRLHRMRSASLAGGVSQALAQTAARQIFVRKGCEHIVAEAVPNFAAYVRQ